ncbi:TetR/AcrR family transcriptional regulator [Mesorhizobium sp. J428]|uniref:TetR/AcrR family transcriptional regulator n=1 Tax=Mesorhizobium sp. J428 TaxID=2898440 RepID=UPI002151DB03|nr:TetR/AcrR family transcriptional regulator [Mesorhizobium sp. J428]MCR5856411.1 TetR/AcrR family transcriptional regulator [Mesorhizobium sp. J428]
MVETADDAIAVKEPTGKRVRADAQRSLDALLQAAKAVFAASGVDAPVREIAEKAGVGIGTVYRHFPGRADLIAAVFRREIDACADAAAVLAAEYPPFEALTRWFDVYVGFIATKRGLAAALYAGDAAYESLPAHRNERLVPALQGLLDRAVAAGAVRPDVDAYELLNAIGSLYMTVRDEAAAAGAGRMVALLVDGLRYRANSTLSVANSRSAARD